VVTKSFGLAEVAAGSTFVVMPASTNELVALPLGAADAAPDWCGSGVATGTLTPHCHVRNISRNWSVASWPFGASHWKSYERPPRTMYQLSW
jgi:hypothetical protein